MNLIETLREFIRKKELKMKETLLRYIDSLNKSYSTHETTEHSFRGEFKMLCETALNGEETSLCRNTDKTTERYTLINEPRRKAYGAPDYELLKGDVAIAFIEAKNIGDSDLRGLNDKKHKEQFDRYKKAISTIAFTDYLNIVLYENGEETISACIGKVEDGKIILNDDTEQIENFEKIMQRLGKAEPQPIRSASTLAEKMAVKAKLIASILQNAMEKNETPEDKDLLGKLKSFQEYLVHDMTKEQFVDFYSQTVLYGLFVARINDKSPKTFSLLEAAELIPSINPFLKKIFKELALAHLHPFVKGIVEDLVLLFKVSDMDKVLRKYGKDPMVHFYEDFLEAYNPKIKNDFGVWYTPKEVVDFIVDSVDSLLKKSLGIELGLADNRMVENEKWHKVQILDPATGTGTFLASAAEKIHESYKGQEGLWDDDVVKHIIPRMNGFEYLMAPYTMAHLKLATALRLSEISTKIPDRLNIFLTNSLEEDHPEETLDFARYITDESNAASVIKRETPVMVVMGNPPYNEKSANKGEWIMKLMDDYKQEPGMQKKQVGKKKSGEPKYKNTLKEVNAKGINNDYCKFIRLGHNFVKKTHEGILAYICGNTFTKTNIFRGMRYELLRDFDEIYIINLHGSSKFDESEDNEKDENIFNIMVGVSINIFVKKKDSSHEGLASVHYADVFGTRRYKLDYLKGNTLESIPFETIIPEAPFYQLAKKSDDYAMLKKHYEAGFKLDTFMPNKVQGFTTDKDVLAIHDSKKSLEKLLADMVSDKTDEELRNEYGFRDTRDWSWAAARSAIRKNKNTDKYITQVCYRPFDTKWTYLHKDIVGRPRPLIQQSMMGKDNLMLCIGKQGSAIGNTEWSLIFMSSLPTDKNVIPRGGAYLFPMYLYDELGTRTFNFTPSVIKEIECRTGLKLQEDTDTECKDSGFLGTDIMDYIYAVLHSSEYRSTYHEFLQNDFPTIPYPKDGTYFLQMAAYGAKLRKLHSLEDIQQKDFITQYPISEGDNMVTMRKFEDCGNGFGKIWINKYRYFDHVPVESWSLIISGYQPLDKWLKDRIGKKLSGDDIRHYQKMVVALTKTTEITDDIDSQLVL